MGYKGGPNGYINAEGNWQGICEGSINPVDMPECSKFNRLDEARQRQQEENDKWAEIVAGSTYTATTGDDDDGA